MTVRIITDSNGRKHITNEPLLHQTAPAPGYCKHCKQYSIEEPLPAAHRQWVGLTDEEVYPLANEHLHYQIEGYEVSGIYDLARAIEAKLKEKNT
jgi:hypothetical protein